MDPNQTLLVENKLDTLRRARELMRTGDIGIHQAIAEASPNNDVQLECEELVTDLLRRLYSRTITQSYALQREQLGCIIEHLTNS